MPHAEMDWWNCNLPKHLWTREPPKGLEDVNEKDRRIIGTADEEYKLMGWDDVKCLIESNRIDQFQRSPSALRRYRQYIHHLSQTHGSVMSFIITRRLGWASLAPRGGPFAHPEDVKILFNDWPYGVDPRIVHLVVWCKFDIEDDPVTGCLTEASAAMVEEFVGRAFHASVKAENVVWFKNWKSLKSVHALEHFHVMLFDPDMDFVHEITGGDVPQCAIASEETIQDHSAGKAMDPVSSWAPVRIEMPHACL